MYKLIAFSFCVLCLAACNNRDYEEYFNIEKSSRSDLQNFTVQIDTLTLNKIESSYLGEVGYFDDMIAFVDFRFCWVFLFDLEGSLIEKKLGQGRGPFELNMSGIDGFAFLEDGRKIFIGSTNDIHIHDKSWRRTVQSNIDWKGRFKIGSGQMPSNPSPDEPSIYSLDYQNLKLRNVDSKIYMPIYSEHPEFNGFETYDYYKQGNILAELNLETIEVDRLFGRRTPLLLNYKYLFHHSAFNFDVDSKSNFYIAHEIDPTIYVYDNEFKVQAAFGVEGRSMNTQYEALGSMDLKRFRDLYFNERPKKGFYTGIKVFERQNLVFRTYTKGDNEPADGLQIYKDQVLIKDIDVPKGVELVSYKAPYYYSSALINEEEETIKIIRFKLPDNL